MPAPHRFRLDHKAIVDDIVRLHLAFRKRQARKPRRKGDGFEYEPVEPPRPNRPLSGGAAAELEFED